MVVDLESSLKACNTYTNERFIYRDPLLVFQVSQVESTNDGSFESIDTQSPRQRQMAMMKPKICKIAANANLLPTQLSFRRHYITPDDSKFYYTYRQIERVTIPDFRFDLIMDRATNSGDPPGWTNKRCLILQAAKRGYQIQLSSGKSYS